MTDGFKGAVGCAVAAVMVMIMGFFLLIAAVGGGDSASACEAGVTQPGASSAAKGGIPGNYLTLYQKAAKDYGIPWNVLAGIGEVETDHGRSPLPGVTSGENFAGAGGPMQFLQPTWDQYGVDGNGDNRKDRYDPADAIPGAANYLKASGAPSRMKAAIWAYNHSDAYYRLVMDWSKRYSGDGVAIAPDNNAGATCSVPLGTGGTELGRAIVAYAVKFKGLPYIWGGEDPNSGFDCSGLVQYVYAHFGIKLPRTADDQAEVGTKFKDEKQLQPGDLVFSGWDPSEEGANGVGHVAIWAGNGQTFEASQHGVPLHFVSWTPNYRNHTRWFTRVTQLAHKDGAQ